jgi:hypothetical protein
MEIELLAHQCECAPSGWQARRVRPSDFAGEKIPAGDEKRIPAGVGILFSQRGIVPGARKSGALDLQQSPDRTRIPDIEWRPDLVSGL